MTERLIAFLMFIFLLPLFTVLIVLIRLTSKGPAIFWSDRFGKDGEIFSMPKFRTMSVKTPQKATHLLEQPDKYVTKVGALLRKTSLDELPQLLSIMQGKMRFVGPRPALFNQYDLQDLRKKKNVDTLLPGVTGWAQVNGRDDLSIIQKVEFESDYLKRKSFLFDFYIIWLTIVKTFARDGVSH